MNHFLSMGNDMRMMAIVSTVLVLFSFGCGDREDSSSVPVGVTGIWDAELIDQRPLPDGYIPQTWDPGGTYNLIMRADGTITGTVKDARIWPLYHKYPVSGLLSGNQLTLTFTMSSGASAANITIVATLADPPVSVQGSLTVTVPAYPFMGNVLRWRATRRS
jgi:hypothetical protein